MPTWSESDLSRHLNKMADSCRPESKSSPQAKCGLKNEPLEKELQSQIASLLRRNNIWFAWSRTDKRTRSVVGTPDFLFCIEGTPFAWEIKVGHNKLSDEQEAVKIQMEANWWNYRVIRTYKEALEILKFRMTENTK